MALFQAPLDISRESYQTSPEIRVPLKNTLFIYTVKPLGLLFMSWYHFNIPLIIFFFGTRNAPCKVWQCRRVLCVLAWGTHLCTNAFYCICVVVNEYYIEGLFILVVFGLPHGFWCHHVAIVFL